MRSARLFPRVMGAAAVAAAAASTCGVSSHDLFLALFFSSRGLGLLLESRQWNREAAEATPAAAAKKKKGEEKTCSSRGSLTSVTSRWSRKGPVVRSERRRQQHRPLRLFFSFPLEKRYPLILSAPPPARLSTRLCFGYEGGIGSPACWIVSQPACALAPPLGPTKPRASMPAGGGGPASQNIDHQCKRKKKEVNPGCWNQKKVASAGLIIQKEEKRPREVPELTRITRHAIVKKKKKN